MSQVLSEVAEEMRRRTEAWVEALGAGGRVAEHATRDALEGRLGRWIEGRLRRHFSLPEDVAEEVLVDVILKFSRPDGGPITSPFGLLCRIIHSCAIDRLRRLRARTPEGGWMDLDNAADEPPPDHQEALATDSAWHPLDLVAQRQLQDCVRRMLAEFARDKPGYARLLALCLEECSNDEMAATVFELPLAEVSDSHRHRIKNRLLQARKASLPYMRRCHA